MRKNGFIVLLLFLIGALLVQKLWFDAEQEQDQGQVTDDTPLVTGSKQKQAEHKLQYKNVANPDRKNVKVNNQATIKPHDSKAVSISSEHDVTELSQVLTARKGVRFSRLNGYPQIITMRDSSDCENELDMPEEKAVIDISKLSGEEIFVSSHFCIQSALWNWIRNIALTAEKQRNTEQLQHLQTAYNQLVKDINEKGTLILLTQAFLNRAAENYFIYPRKTRGFEDYYSVATLLTKPYYNQSQQLAQMIQGKIVLFSQLNVPPYFVMDVLDNTPAEIRQIKLEPYLDKLEQIFIAQQKLIDKPLNEN